MLCIEEEEEEEKRKAHLNYFLNKNMLCESDFKIPLPEGMGPSDERIHKNTHLVITEHIQWVGK